MSRHRPLLWLTLITLLLTSCISPVQQDDNQIRERIASIRTAILALQQEGIVRWGTSDWSFTGPDGKSFNQASYLIRTRGLFARVVTIDSLDTHVDRLDVQGDTAAVEITQTMVRHEREAATGKILHLHLRYRESHTWVRTDDGWRVRRVAFIGTPERTVLTTP